MLGLFRSLWEYRGFVWSSIRNEFVARFARSRLGGLWMIINPLAQVAIYALVLSNVLAAKLPGIDNKYSYALYLMAGILAWSLFSEIVGRCLTLFIDQGNLMKKMRFPRITLPVIVVGSCLLNYVLLFAALLLVFALFGQELSLQLFWIIPLTVVVTALAVGIGLVLGILNVFVRDTGQVVPIVMQAWFWLTPIVYPATIIPEDFKGFMAFNPMYPIATAFHDALVYSRMPNIEGLMVPTLVAVLLLLLGLIMFRRAAPEMVDVL